MNIIAVLPETLDIILGSDFNSFEIVWCFDPGTIETGDKHAYF
jgi:hypothetical protein